MEKKKQKTQDQNKGPRGLPELYKKPGTRKTKKNPKKKKGPIFDWVVYSQKKMEKNTKKRGKKNRKRRDLF